MGILQKFRFRRPENSFQSLNRRLLEFSSAFSSITDISQLIPNVMARIREIMDVREVALLLSERDSNRINLAYSRDITLNPRLRLRGGYFFLREDKFINWLQINRIPFVMSKMIDVFSFFPEEERDILRFIGTEIALGLEAHNRFTGVLHLGRKNDGKEYNETDKQILITIAAQAALAIENGRLHLEAMEQMRAKRELEIAGEFQKRMLPSGPPDCAPDLDIDGICIPCSEVGGDYYDFIEFPGDNLGIVLGDVAGHGMSSGLLMAMAKSCIHTAAQMNINVTDMMKILNEMIFKLDEKTAMMTCVLGVIDSKRKEFVFSNAGHIYPYHYSKKKGVITWLESSSYPLGKKRNYSFPMLRLSLEPGDVVLCCSDGFVESRNRYGKIYGFERMERTFLENAEKPASGIISSIVEDLFSLLGGVPHEDDLTLLVVKVKEI